MSIVEGTCNIAHREAEARNNVIRKKKQNKTKQKIFSQDLPSKLNNRNKLKQNKKQTNK